MLVGSTRMRVFLRVRGLFLLLLSFLRCRSNHIFCTDIASFLVHLSYCFVVLRVAFGFEEVAFWLFEVFAAVCACVEAEFGYYYFVVFYGVAADVVDFSGYAAFPFVGLERRFCHGASTSRPSCFRFESTFSSWCSSSSRYNSFSLYVGSTPISL